jgi:hypothetical protein
MNLFVKFSCGCVGINPEITKPDPFPILIEPCDGDDYNGMGNLTFHTREDLAGKAWMTISDERQAKYIAEIFKLIIDGHSLRRVKSALGLKY